jgi:hypothetical protein
MWENLISSEYNVALASQTDKVVLGPDPRRWSVILPNANTVNILFRFGGSTASVSEYQIESGLPPVVICRDQWGDIVTHELHLYASSTLASYVFWVTRIKD